ncbi:probable insulin-like peptide 7 [Musca vetustissima]|uniref:probable insulin-like peptide 7 n=1 Tax=Musca vetustissima TaxID=27455 RepID=UPI002AB7AE6C|nr:probable insulin-like peptide 7 [Musca vetustissima]
MNIWQQKYLFGVFCSGVIFLLQSVIIGNAARTDIEGLELLFRQRTPDDWQNVWHSESHSRCRDKLLRHMYWACEMDIYRLTRRGEFQTNEAIVKRSKVHSPMTKWFTPDIAHAFLRTRRTRDPSITSECCTKTGCTWEEYAEYCPSNKRRNHY